MTAITIAQRYRPFSHRPGTSAYLPRTALLVVAFPTHLKLVNYGTIVFEGVGPCRAMTLLQDLERGELHFWAESSQGRLHCRLFEVEGKLYFDLKKAPPQLCVLWEGEEIEKRALMAVTSVAQRSHERLFLGSSKKQEWESLYRRHSLAELLPLWHCLGQQVPLATTDSGNSLLQACCAAVDGEIEELLTALLRAGFSYGGILVPQLSDSSQWGYPLPPCRAAAPHALLSSGAALIRRLFVDVDGDRVALLPARLSLPAGKWVAVALSPDATLDFEWSNGKLRRLIVHVNAPTTFTFQIKRLTSCRFQGERHRLATPCTFARPGRYLLDQFQQ